MQLSAPALLYNLTDGRNWFPFISPIRRITGYSRREIIGRNCRFLQGPKTDLATVQRLATALHEVRPGWGWGRGGAGGRGGAV